MRSFGQFLMLLFLWFGDWGIYGLEWEVDSITSLQLTNAPSPPSIVEEELLGSLRVPLDTIGSGFEAKGHLTAGSAIGIFGDLDIFSVSHAFQTPGSIFRVFKGTLGRFTLTEPTGLILNHPGDGFRFDITALGIDLSIAEGYTGFVNRASSGISMTLQDQANSSNYFAPPRLVSFVEAGFTILDAHKLTLGVLAQKDTNPISEQLAAASTASNSALGGALDTQYFTLKVAGPVVEQVFYEVFGTLGTGSTLIYSADANSPSGSSYQYRGILSELIGGSVTYFRPGWLSSAFKLRLLFTSGDSTAATAIEGSTSSTPSAFTPITPTTLGVVFSPALSNLVYYELGGSVKPWSNSDLVTGVKLLGFQRSVAAAVNAPGVLANGPVWLGEEIDLTGAWPIKSDILLAVGVGAFFPTSGTYASGSTGAGAQLAASMTASLGL